MTSDRSKTCPRVVLADDHPISRYGMRIVLTHLGAAEVVAEAGNAAELFTVLSEVPCDVVLSDYVMPDERHADGIGMIRCLARVYPSIPLVVVTALHDVTLFESALREGVRGWVEKSDDASELIAAVYKVIAGHIYISPSMRSAMIDRDRS
ncbi:response regulator [Dyella flagellata]|uniref:Response regulatory domain-containing protein n=1 Tax=Dyella flagellata TaxID=1867833 RepID=A0ABQ5XBA7_9GAMM|nr:response regulator transcription factor [Dyella flagellata]GLQ87825.1 hypothetical protein GCM10007898_13930 [Dyella flagellata]